MKTECQELKEWIRRFGSNEFQDWVNGLSKIADAADQAAVALRKQSNIG